MGHTPGPREKSECEDKYRDNCDQCSATYLSFAIIVRHVVLLLSTDRLLLSCATTIAHVEDLGSRVGDQCCDSQHECNARKSPFKEGSLGPMTGKAARDGLAIQRRS